MDKSFKNALIFLAGTILITWAFYIPIPLLGWSPYAFPGVILLFFGGSVPTWLAVIMVFTTYDKAERKDYFQRLYQLKRIRPLWWLALLLLFPAVTAAGIGLSMAFGGAVPGMENLKAVIAGPVVLLPLIGLSFLSGPFSEELGWRGFAMDPLLRRFGFTGGTVLLGFIWGIWHLPLFFMPQTWHGQIGFTGFLLFMLLSIGLSVIMGWVYVNTRRSILTALLLHLSSNFSAQLIAPSDSTFEFFRTMLVAAIGIGIAVYMIKSRMDKAENYLPEAARDRTMPV